MQLFVKSKVNCYSSNLNHRAFIFIISNNLFFQNIDKIDCEKEKEKLMENERGENSGGEMLLCNPKGKKCWLK